MIGDSVGGGSVDRGSVGGGCVGEGHLLVVACSVGGRVLLVGVCW